MEEKGTGSSRWENGAGYGFDLTAFWNVVLRKSGDSFGLCHVCSGFGRVRIGAGRLSFLDFVGWMVRTLVE